MFIRNRSQIILQCIFISILITIALSITTTISQAQTATTWRSVVVGGGGFVPGIIFHPTHQGIVYARTDMGGAYRWDNVQAQWIPLTDMMDRTNSDYMGVLSIALDPNDPNLVYMECGKYTQSWAGNGAILSSTNKGNTWTIIPLSVKIGGNEDGRGAGERLQVDPNVGSILFMGTTKDGLWKSTNFGKSWAKVNSFTSTNVNFVLFDKSSGSIGYSTQRIFVSVVDKNGESLYCSEDGGTSWSILKGQPSGVMAIRANIADTFLYVTFANSNGPNGATAGSVWKYSISNGVWTNILPSSSSHGFSGISIYPKNTNIVIVSTLNRWDLKDEIYLSTDAGFTWIIRLTNSQMDYSSAPYTEKLNPHWISSLEMDPFDSSKVICVTGYGILACDNFFSQKPIWYFKNQNLEEMVPMQIINPPYTNLLSASADYDGFRHDNLKVSPPHRFSPPKGTTFSIAFAGKSPLKLVKSFNSSPYGAYSNDGGITWTDFKNFPKGATAGGTWSIAISADGKNIIWKPLDALLSYSSDIGNTWEKSSGGFPDAILPVADRVNSEIFYAFDGAGGQLWISHNSGKEFKKSTAEFPKYTLWNPQDVNLTAVPDKEGDLWFCCATGGLFHSTDSGLTAAKINSVTTAYRIGFGKAYIGKSYPAIYLYGIIDGKIGIYRSDDTGSTWIRINDDNHQYGWIHQITGDSKIYGRCYISTEGRGIIYNEPEK
jgi:photosystem II stability/assembly factor-like uncharacterized protein